MRVEIAGTGRTGLGRVHFSESLYVGTHARFSIRVEEGKEIKIGDEVRLGLRAGPHDSESVLLVCCEVTASPFADEGRVLIGACDPLSFCGGDIRFQSRLGDRELPALIREVLEEYELSCTVDADEATFIEPPWLLQARETNAEFIERIAALAGLRVYWDRDRLAVRTIAGASAADPIQLKASDTAFSVRSTRRAERRSCTVRWVDPESRELNSLDLVGSIAGGHGKPVVNQGIAGFGGEPRAAQMSELASGRFGVTSDFGTHRVELRLGQLVKIGPNGVPLRIEEIRHLIEPNGRYNNDIVAHSPDGWGMSMPTRERSQMGVMLQAEVVENEDPNRQQRVRVVLSEDPESRATPWIPTLSISGGSASGVHWLPEVGELVLVSSDTRIPEQLYCLGSLRSREQPADEAWAASDNARKSFVFRKGLGIYVDEDEGVLRLESDGAKLELRGSRVTISAGDIELEADGSLDATAKGAVRIDGSSIELG